MQCTLPLTSSKIKRVENCKKIFSFILFLDVVRSRCAYVRSTYSSGVKSASLAVKFLIIALLLSIHSVIFQSYISRCPRESEAHTKRSYWNFSHTCEDVLIFILSRLRNIAIDNREKNIYWSERNFCEVKEFDENIIGGIIIERPTHRFCLWRVKSISEDHHKKN